MSRGNRARPPPSVAAVAEWDGRGRALPLLGLVDLVVPVGGGGSCSSCTVIIVPGEVVLGIVAAIIAILLAVFDSWGHRPHGGRARRSEARDTGWSEAPAQHQRRVPAAAAPVTATRAAAESTAPNNYRAPAARRPGPAEPGPAATAERRPTGSHGQGQPPRTRRASHRARTRPSSAQPTRVNPQQPQPYRPAPPQLGPGRVPYHRVRPSPICGRAGPAAPVRRTRPSAPTTAQHRTPVVRSLCAGSRSSVCCHWAGCLVGEYLCALPSGCRCTRPFSCSREPGWSARCRGPGCAERVLDLAGRDRSVRRPRAARVLVLQFTARPATVPLAPHRRPRPVLVRNDLTCATQISRRTDSYSV